MSIVDTIINKALELKGITERPAGSNNVQLNTHYYGHEVEDGKSNEDDAYPWCVTYLWDVSRLCGASNISCDGLRTASMETVYDTYNNGRLFSTGQAGDFILIRTSTTSSGRRVNHMRLVISRNNDGSYATTEGNTGGNIADGGGVLRRTRCSNGTGYTVVTFARPFYSGSEPINETPVSAQLTAQGVNVNARTSPITGAVVKALNIGARIQAGGRALIDGDPWFHIIDGRIGGKYTQGRVEDYNDNNHWWYVEKGYSYSVSVWKTIAGKDYCSGADGYLFVECYIKSEANSTYYWVDDDGAYLNQYDITVSDPEYRIVENFRAENAYKGQTILDGQ